MNRQGQVEHYTLDVIFTKEIILTQVTNNITHNINNNETKML